MNYPKAIKDLSRKLRKNGNSWRSINKKLNIPVTTIRSWCESLKLTDNQKIQLKNRVLKALAKGRNLASKNKHLQRVTLEKKLGKEGYKEIKKLNKRELFVAGITLYWAEGFKNKEESRLGFCNSDPQMILFYLSWLRKTLKVPLENISARVTLNESHKNRVKEVEEYWSKITGIPLKNFTKAFYHRINWKKGYNNRENYHGVLRVHVKKSLNLLRKMRGWIEGLKHSIEAG